MAEAPENAPAAAKKSGGIGGKLINAIGIFVVCLAAVVAGGYVNATLHPMPELKLGKDGTITAVAAPAAAASADAGKPAIYFALDPPLVVNFQDGDAVRFLQVSMEAMARDQKAIDGVKKNLPLIRNNLLLLMSNRDYKVLMTRQGKEQLRQEALGAIQAVEKQNGDPPVEDLLFTSFVVQ
ncbi:MAG: flagellar basal body-associated FliL family protein [Gammaproteobacteria bacterium]|nr:flagellar basal body-associated FliL family protein [Gammaproteobacteria bacterium]